MKHVSPADFDLPAIPRPRVGELTVEAYLSIHLRDWYLQGACRRFFPGLSRREQADQLSKAMVRYAATGWIVDRAAERMPARHNGRLTGYLWQAMKARPVVLGPDAIRLRVLAIKT